ncbi:alpha/beta hydrolase [Actinotalea ferrariae]|uniref:alpha/beta fold hydrolase n=1 Tax=Actinotalea ferrariae TaxID=1386098 RepID=UPI001C8B16DA|nr:alpha/beta hydrolase [Actinotalea ferrariae]MBX9246416.1 alpha/beta hydrolase [Actinotalea ferrariae]
MTSFRSDDGLRIAYRTWGTADGTPVVLHHGFGASAEQDWVRTGLVDALVAAGRRVVALDARGHGASDKPHDPARYGEPRMADDVVALVEALGAPAVDLVGYSMGALVSLFTAAREPRVRRLVVGGIGAAAVELGGVDTRVLDPEALRHALLTDDPSTITHPGAAGFRGLADETGADRTALAAQASARHHGTLPLAEITVPTLVLAGRDDPLAARPEVLAAALPDATLRLVDGDHGAVLHDAGFHEAIVTFVGAG